MVVNAFWVLSTSVFIHSDDRVVSGGKAPKSLRSPEALLVIPLPVVGLEPEPKAHAKHEVWPSGVLQVPGWQLL